MIRLYDWYQDTAKDLDYSLEVAGFSSPVIVINENGFLPRGVLSPYAYFCGMSDEQESNPLYFNQVPVPDYWEIAGNNHQGEIFNYSNKQANIYYAEPHHERLVQNVDWLDSKGKVRYTDHYNQYGWRFAQTSFTQNEELIQKTYFNQKQEEVIIENVKTGDILLTWKDQLYTFKGRVAFIIFFLKQMGYDLSSIWINSLSTPLFVSLDLKEEGDDILFWQEPLHDELPGNMQLLLNQVNQRVTKIVIQDKATYDNALQLAPKEQHHQFLYLPYVYPQVSSQKAIDDCLILTNSDQIEALANLVEGLPQKHFHIAALTEMSERLMQFEFKENVTLYPNTTPAAVKDLLKHCSVYLDINHGSEILSGLRQAYEHQLEIFAFDETVHNRNFVPADHIYSNRQIDQLIQAIAAYSVDQQKALYDKRQNERLANIRHYQEDL